MQHVAGQWTQSPSHYGAEQAQARLSIVRSRKEHTGIVYYMTAKPREEVVVGLQMSVICIFEEFYFILFIFREINATNV
jgi:hypothetical protein